MEGLIDECIKKLGTSATLKYADEDWGQLEFPNPPVKWPCALVSIYSIDYTSNGRDRTKVPQSRQQGAAIIEFRIANLKLVNSSSKAPAAQRVSALKIHALVQHVHELIQGWSPGGEIGNFMRLRTKKENRDDGVQEYVVQYTVGLSDV